MTSSLINFRGPKEFHTWLKQLSIHQSIQSGDSPSLCRVMRLLSRDLEGRITFKNGKFQYLIYRIK